MKGVAGLQQRALAALRSGSLDEAERCYRELLVAFPHPGVLHNLGLVLVRLHRDAEAVQCFERSLAARPAEQNTQLALSNALLNCDRPSDALALCNELLAVAPGSRDARQNRAIALRALNRHAEAAAVLGQLLADDPLDADTEFNLALAELMLGRYESAWNHYEARWRGSQAQPPLPVANGAVWRRGDPLRGRAVLVQSEQGLGDTLQFLRWVPRLDAECKRVDLQVQPELVDFLRRQWADRRIDPLGDEGASDIDCRIALLSVPLALGISNPGSAAPYLAADPARIEQWAQRLPHCAGGYIGVGWRGNPLKRHNPQRSLPVQALRTWLEMAERRGLAIVSVQRDVNEDERRWLEQFRNVHVPGSDLSDFDDTAAVMALARQIVSVDTSLIHLAGALGRPAVVLLRFCSDWRWGIDRPNGATYQSVLTLRQPVPGDWDSVVSALVGLLPFAAGEGAPVSARAMDASIDR